VADAAKPDPDLGFPGRLLGEERKGWERGRCCVEGCRLQGGAGTDRSRGRKAAVGATGRCGVVVLEREGEGGKAGGREEREVGPSLRRWGGSPRVALEMAPCSPGAVQQSAARRCGRLPEAVFPNDIKHEKCSFIERE
jgi:hypothetical protein